MLKRILVLTMMAFASCQSLAIPPTPNEHTVIPASTEETSWMETEMNGVRLEMRMPKGWAADAEHGLLLAEHTSSTDTGDVEVTVLIHCFVPLLDNFDLPQEATENMALHVLEQAVTMPTMVGQNVVVSEPIGFNWGERDAAYYLLSGADGSKTIVIAIEANLQESLVVVNISMPASEESRVRNMLPEVLDGLRINGVALDGDALDILPDPLPFPSHHYSPSVTPSVIQ
jgi:hypothetical protein